MLVAVGVPVALTDAAVAKEEKKARPARARCEGGAILAEVHDVKVLGMFSREPWKFI